MVSHGHTLPVAHELVVKLGGAEEKEEKGFGDSLQGCVLLV